MCWFGNRDFWYAAGQLRSDISLFFASNNPFGEPCRLDLSLPALSAHPRIRMLVATGFAWQLAMIGYAQSPTTTNQRTFGVPTLNASPNITLPSSLLPPTSTPELETSSGWILPELEGSIGDKPSRDNGLAPNGLPEQNAARPATAPHLPPPTQAATQRGPKPGQGGPPIRRLPKTIPSPQSNKAPEDSDALSELHKATLGTGLQPDGSDLNQPTLDVSLSEAIRRTLYESAEIQVRRQDIAFAFEDIDISKSVFDPLFYWNYNQQYGRRPSEFSTTRPRDDHASANAELQILKHTTWGTRLDLSAEWLHSHDDGTSRLLNPMDDSKLSFTITQPFLRGAGLKFNTAPIYLASRFTDITSLRFERTVTQVMRETEVIFWEFHFRYENWKDQRKTYETAQHLQKFAKAKYDVGLNSELDFERAQSALAQRLIKLTEARNAATVTENKLKGITNANLGRIGPTVKWQPSEEPVILKPDFRIEEEICRGFNNRPDFQAAVIDLESQEIRIDVHENALLPIINLETGVSSVALGGRDAGEVDGSGNRLISPYVGDLGDMFEHLFWRDGVVWNIGVIVQFPFYRREANAALRQRHAVAKQAFARLVRAERSIIREVREAIEIIETTHIKVEQAKRNREFTESIYDKTLVQMQNGFTDVKRVVDALDQVAEARILENKVVAEYLNALSQLELATGTYLVNRGVHLDRMGAVSTLSEIAYGSEKSFPGSHNPNLKTTATFDGINASIRTDTTLETDFDIPLETTGSSTSFRDAPSARLTRQTLRAPSQASVPTSPGANPPRTYGSQAYQDYREIISTLRTAPDGAPTARRFSLFR